MKKIKVICLLLAVITLSACRGPRGDEGSNGQTVVGPTGPQGIQGLPGLVGPMGPAGLNGSNGSDASIGIVQLCPGVSNYGTFVEIALRINGDLYAVYSANGGFMTYLAPGNYTSNGIGAACNLTVNADGTVSY